MACKLCGALSCGQHGQRDPNLPGCVGVECDPSLLVASAAAASSGDKQEVVSAVAANIPPQFMMADLSEFIARRPAYRPWLEAAVAREARHAGPLPVVPWNEAAQDLITAAGVLVRRLEISEDLLHPQVRDVLSSWR
jgi:hypothetical protein